MKRKALRLLNICLFVFGIEAFAQTAQFQFPITVTDNLGSPQQLFVGVDPTGTDGIDISLGETERPPLPPTGVFEARFIGNDIGVAIGQGLVRDYRQGTVNTTGNRIHELTYQLSTGATSVTFAWTLPSWAVGHLETFGGGTINVTMTGTDDTTLNSPSPGNRTLQLTVNYTPPLPVQLASFTGTVANQQGHVRLDWRTITETNNYGFFVQRSFIDQNTYQTISDLIPGHGTTLEPHDYAWTDVNGQSGTRYYRLKQVDLDGTVTYCEPIQVTVVTGVGEKETPRDFKLNQNYPNPFNPTTTIRFDLPQASHVTLMVYDITGRQVAELVKESKEAGYHEARFEPGSLASGVYLYRLQAGSFTSTRKLAVLK